MRAVLLVAACVAACAPGVPSSTAPPRGARPASYAGMFGIPGEGMAYRVSLRGVTVAAVQVSVGHIHRLDKPPHHRGLSLASRGHTVGVLTLLGDVDWKLATTLDLDTGRGVTSLEEATIVLAGERDHNRHDRWWDAFDSFDDLHTAAAKLRAWHPAPGERLRLDVQIDEAHLRVEAWLGGREVIAAPRGPMPAVRYDGLAAGKARFAVWISDDAARVPLRLRAESRWGAIAVDLVEYEPPIDAR